MCRFCKNIFDKTLIGKTLAYSFDMDVTDPQDWQDTPDCWEYWEALAKMECIELDLIDRDKVLYYKKVKENPTDV